MMRIMLYIGVGVGDGGGCLSFPGIFRYGSDIILIILITLCLCLCL